MNIKTFKQYSTGGFSYVDENNNLLGTGTTTDSAAPDQDNLTGVFIYCQNPSRTLYASVSPTNPVTVRFKDGTTTSVTTRKKLMEDLAEFFFYRVTGTAGNLDDVLTIGNNAGSNNIDMNGQDIVNIDEVETKIIKTQLLSNLDIQADLDIIFNPNGIIDANGKTLNMRNGEIHAAHLIHGRNNTNFKVQAKGTGDLIFETNNIERLKITDTGDLIFNFFYTIELIAALTVDFYAPFNLKINSISNLVNSPTTTILDDGVAYTLGNTITAGSKITVTVNTAAVINLNTIQV
jgi:archaellin